MGITRENILFIPKLYTTFTSEILIRETPMKENSAHIKNNTTKRQRPWCQSVGRPCNHGDGSKLQEISSGEQKENGDHEGNILSRNSSNVTPGVSRSSG